MSIRLPPTLISAVAFAALTACQTYDFEPVVPLAISQTRDVKIVTVQRSPPNLMLVLDISGSMGSAAGNGTRISEMKDAMNSFLTANRSLARYGVVFFPTS